MLALIILAFLVGAVLGMRFRVLILVPVITLAVGAIVGAGVVSGSAYGDMLLTATIAAMSLQFGYLGGAFTRSILASSPSARVETSSQPIKAAH